MTAPACIGEAISWPRLEAFAAGGGAPATRSQIDAHLAACPACRHCLAELRADVVALPPLAVPAARPRRAWWQTWLVPALGVAAAAAIALVVLRGLRGAGAPPREDVVAIKGVGDVVVGVVRERGGAISDDARTFAPGDRWKVVVTCPPAASAAFTVEVSEAGPGAAATIDRPLPPATLPCGNRVVLPGAFALTGMRAHRVCVRVTSADDTGRACVTIAPE